MSEFVNKVYDQYLNKDFSCGQDNLNPVREISLAADDDVVQELISSIQTKVDEIDSRYPDVEPLQMGNMNTGSGFEGDPTCLTEAKRKAGGDFLLIPAFENEEDMLVDEVKRLIAKLAGIAGIDDLNDVNCDGSFDLLTGELIDSSDDKLDNELMDEHYDSDNGAGLLNDSLPPAEDSANFPSGDLPINEAKDPEEADTKTQEAAKENELEITDNNKTTQNNVKECAKADLAILKVILAILKVIKTIKKILNPTLNIIVELCEIITLACQVWHNPPALAEIIQKIINKIIAILCMVISMLLQMLWDLLGLDCITEESMDIIDQIKDCLAGINSIFAEIDATAVSFANGIDTAVNAVQMAQDAVEEAIRSIPSWQQIGEYFDLQKLADGLNTEGSWKKTLKKAGKGAMDDILEQSGIQAKVNEAIAKVDQVGGEWRKISQSAAKMTGANSGVQRLMSSFQNVTSL